MEINIVQTIKTKTMTVVIKNETSHVKNPEKGTNEKITILKVKKVEDLENPKNRHIVDKIGTLVEKILVIGFKPNIQREIETKAKAVFMPS